MTDIIANNGAEIYDKDCGQLSAVSAVWRIPAKAHASQSGPWGAVRKADLFEALPFIAERRGVMTPDVLALRDAFQSQGMTVLEFAFDGESSNLHQPHNQPHDLVAYTATHDNNTNCGWFEPLSNSEQQAAGQYLKRRFRVRTVSSLMSPSQSRRCTVH